MSNSCRYKIDNSSPQALKMIKRLIRMIKIKRILDSYEQSNTK